MIAKSKKERLREQKQGTAEAAEAVAGTSRAGARDAPSPQAQRSFQTFGDRATSRSSKNSKLATRRPNRKPSFYDHRGWKMKAALA